MGNISKTRLSDHEKAVVRYTIRSHLAHARRIAPFPFEYPNATEAVLELVQDPRLRIWVARTRELEAVQGMVEIKYTCNTFVRTQRTTGYVLSVVSETPSMPFYHGNVYDVKLKVPSNHKHADAIHEWAVVSAGIAQARQDCLEFMTNTISACHTPGQVKLLLPDLVPLLSVQLQTAINAQSRTSRWPKGANMVDIVTKREAHCNFLAQCMMSSNATSDNETYHIVAMAL